MNKILCYTTLVGSLLSLNATANNITPEKAQHRLPPVIFSIDIPKVVQTSKNYTFSWSIMGYHDNYDSRIVVYDKYGDPLDYAQESPNSITEGKYSWGDIQSNKFSYSTNLNFDFDQNQYLTVRFFSSPTNDPIDNTFLSTIVPGGLGYEAGDTTGRKIKIYGVTTFDLYSPCSSCGYSGPYDRDWHGDNTNHLGKDYPAFVGDSVRAIADGQVYKVYSSLAGFGGLNPTKNGHAIIIKHKKENGDVFYALYGHVSSNLSTGEFVSGNQIIGSVEDFLYGDQSWPHLHFGIWDNEFNFPTSSLGYGDDRSFVDPVSFLNSTKYQPWSE